MAALAPVLEGASLGAARQLVTLPANASLVQAAAISAVAQALLAALAAQRGVAAHAVLGHAARPAVRAYANINRATTLRTPAGFVATALRAQQHGFKAFKAAPFEGLTPALCACAEGRRLARHGIDCLLALRDALGPGARLMVDCHWRFDEAHALDTLRALRLARLHWFECPLPETPAHWPALRRLRAACRDEGLLLAAAETQIGAPAFQDLFDAALYDVVMPDVKYCGGPWEMLAIAQCAADAGVMFSPHNPTGPVCTQHSLHLAAVAPECDMLELQFDESPLYGALAPLPPTLSAEGLLPISVAPGLGLTIDEAVLAAHPYRAVPLGIEALSGL